MAIAEVVKYNGSPDVYAWKYPNEELGTWTQLIVNEAQEAVLYKGGKALDLFGSGRHTLETANIPLLCNLVNLPFGGRSPFAAEVWFINKAHSLDIKWGTATPIQIQDPKYGVFIPVRANGIFGIQIADSKKFLVKLVGTMSVFDKDSLVKYFRGIYITKVKDAISEYLIKKKVSALEINAYIEEISHFLEEKLRPYLAEYGIFLVNFNVNDISVPEEDPAVLKLKDALAKRAEMNIIGYSYQQERSFDTLEGAAKNPGSMQAPLMGAGMGLGMGVGMGGAVGGAFGSMAREVQVGAEGNGAPQRQCPKCHAPMPAGQRFCGACGCDTQSPENKVDGESESGGENVCGGCGSKLDPSVKFCPECGKRYNPCPKCGADLKDGQEQCHKCGASTAAPRKCKKCGSDILGDAKFCPECGEPLTKKCPKCNAPAEGEPKFCPECGAAMEEALGEATGKTPE